MTRRTSNMDEPPQGDKALRRLLGAAIYSENSDGGI